MTNTIHVVMRSTGEYSDRSETAICAYTDEALAREHVEEAGRRIREIEAAIREEKREDDYSDRDEEMQRLLRRYFDKDQTYGDAEDARYEDLSAWLDQARHRHNAMRAANEFDPGCEDYDDRTYFLYSVELRTTLPVKGEGHAP